MNLDHELLALYFTAPNGEVFNRKSGHQLTSFIGRCGYERVSLSFNGARQRLVHRLIALSYISNPDNKPFINHKNGIKTDNRIENLEWVDRQENADHAVKIGLYKSQRYLVYKNDFFIGEYDSTEALVKELGLGKPGIYDVANGRQKTTGGYKIEKI